MHKLPLNREVIRLLQLLDRIESDLDENTNLPPKPRAKKGVEIHSSLLKAKDIILANNEQAEPYRQRFYDLASRLKTEFFMVP